MKRSLPPLTLVPAPAVADMNPDHLILPDLPAATAADTTDHDPTGRPESTEG